MKYNFQTLEAMSKAREIIHELDALRALGCVHNLEDEICEFSALLSDFVNENERRITINEARQTTKEKTAAYIDACISELTEALCYVATREACFAIDDNSSVHEVAQSRDLVLTFPNRDELRFRCFVPNSLFTDEQRELFNLYTIALEINEGTVSNHFAGFVYDSPKQVADAISDFVSKY